MQDSGRSPNLCFKINRPSMGPEALDKDLAVDSASAGAVVLDKSVAVDTSSAGAVSAAAEAEAVIPACPASAVSIGTADDVSAPATTTGKWRFTLTIPYLHVYLAIN